MTAQQIATAKHIEAQVIDYLGEKTADYFVGSIVRQIMILGYEDMDQVPYFMLQSIIADNK